MRSGSALSTWRSVWARMSSCTRNRVPVGPSGIRWMTDASASDRTWVREAPVTASAASWVKLPAKMPSPANTRCWPMSSDRHVLSRTTVMFFWRSGISASSEASISSPRAIPASRLLGDSSRLQLAASSMARGSPPKR